MSRYACRLWLGALGIVGCALNSQPVERRADFDPAEYAPYDQPGTSVVSGQAFLRTRGGEVRYGAGSEVYLSPVTSYSKEWWRQVIVRGAKFSSGADPRASKYSKMAIADGEGRFSFAELPAGDYFVVSSVYWEVPSSLGLTSTGGRVGRQVHVGSGQQVTLVLNELSSTPADGPATSSVATTPTAATTPLTSPVPFGVAATEPSQRPEPVTAAASDPPAPSPQVASIPAPVRNPPPPAVPQKTSAAVRSKSELQRILNLRRILGDLTRIQLIADYQETGPEVLRVDLGHGYQNSQAREYHLERLRKAYAESTNFDAALDAQLELWQGGRRVGVYTRDGLFMDGQ